MGPCLDVHCVEEPVHGHEEQVEEVDGGALDHPVDPGGEVVPPDDSRVKGARYARSYIRTETLSLGAKIYEKWTTFQNLFFKCGLFSLVIRWIRTSQKKEDPQFCGSPF